MKIIVQSHVNIYMDKGEGLALAKPFCHGHLSWIFILVCLSNDSGIPNDEEAIVYRGMS